MTSKSFILILNAFHHLASLATSPTVLPLIHSDFGTLAFIRFLVHLLWPKDLSAFAVLSA